MIQRVQMETVFSKTSESIKSKNFNFIRTNLKQPAMLGILDKRKQT